MTLSTRSKSILQASKMLRIVASFAAVWLAYLQTATAWNPVAWDENNMPYGREIIASSSVLHVYSDGVHIGYLLALTNATEAQAFYPDYTFANYVIGLRPQDVRAVEATRALYERLYALYYYVGNQAYTNLLKVRTFRQDVEIIQDIKDAIKAAVPENFSWLDATFVKYIVSDEIYTDPEEALRESAWKLQELRDALNVQVNWFDVTWFYQDPGQLAPESGQIAPAAEYYAHEYGWKHIRQAIQCLSLISVPYLTAYGESLMSYMQVIPSGTRPVGIYEANYTNYTYEVGGRWDGYTPNYWIEYHNDPLFYGPTIITGKHELLVEHQSTIGYRASYDSDEETVRASSLDGTILDYTYLRVTEQLGYEEPDFWVGPQEKRLGNRYFVVGIRTNEPPDYIRNGERKVYFAFDQEQLVKVNEKAEYQRLWTDDDWQTVFYEKTTNVVANVPAGEAQLLPWHFDATSLLYAPRDGAHTGNEWDEKRVQINEYEYVSQPQYVISEFKVTGQSGLVWLQANERRYFVVAICKPDYTYP